MIEITKAAPKHFCEIQRFLGLAFTKPKKFFPDNYPSVWTKEAVDYNHIYTIRDNKKLVSLARIFPLNLLLNGAKVKTAGIGSVSTLDEYRGKSYMSLLLKHCILQMRKEGFAISILWGLRKRYMNFGWEKCGRTIALKISVNNLAKLNKPDMRINTFRFEKDILDEIYHAYNTHTFRMQRTLKETELKLKGKGLSVFHSGHKKDFAYICVCGDYPKGKIAEFGGNPETLVRLLLEFSKKYGASMFELIYPDSYSIPGRVLEAGYEWNITDTAMLKIVDLRKTLESFKVFTKKETKLLARELNNFTEPEIVRILFGTFEWYPGKLSYKAKQIIQRNNLNIFIWPLDRI